MSRIYLDNAATSWPKPEAVYVAVDHYQREIGAAAGRGAYREATESTAIVQRARRKLAQLMNAPDLQRIIFTHNGTDSLNLAIHGLLDMATDRPHVVTTVVEHNSVLRPLRSLEAQGRIVVTRVRCDGEGMVSPDDVRGAMRNNTRLVVLCHASNVTGAIQPAGEIGRIAREHGALFLLDAAQTLGEVPIDVAALPVDLLAAPGHKGLLGPLGTGVLYVAPGAESGVTSVRQGGTGTQSEIDRQPDALPEKYESGNLNLAGIAGLEAGVQWLLDRTVTKIRDEARQLTGQLLDGLRSITGVRVFGPRESDRRVGLVSIALKGYDPQELAATLDSAFGVQTRAGLHCAPLMHQSLGTIAAGGTLRFSLGPFNTSADVAQGVQAVGEIVAAQ